LKLLVFFSNKWINSGSCAVLAENLRPAVRFSRRGSFPDPCGQQLFPEKQKGCEKMIAHFFTARFLILTGRGWIPGRDPQVAGRRPQAADRRSLAAAGC